MDREKAAVESLSTITAAPVPITVAGRQYLMSPLTLADYGTIEAALRRERAGRPADTAPSVEHGDDSETETLLPVPPEEMAQWMSSAAGMTLVLWLTLRKQHPAVTWEGCRELVAAEPDHAWLDRELDRASGMPPGNSCGQVRPSRQTRMNLAMPTNGQGSRRRSAA